MVRGFKDVGEGTGVLVRVAVDVDVGAAVSFGCASAGGDRVGAAVGGSRLAAVVATGVEPQPARTTAANAMSRIRAAPLLTVRLVPACLEFGQSSP